MFIADELLLEQAIAGDSDALGELMIRVREGVRAGLGGGIGKPWRQIVDEEDVLQVTFLEAFLRINSFQSRGIPAFVSWLQQIARNNLRDAVRGLTRAKRPDPRKQARTPATTDSVIELFDLAGGDSSTPSRAVGRDERKAVLAECFQRLPPNYASVLRLYDLEGKDVEEVARALSRSTGAVFMLRARAIERLRELLPAVSALLSGRS